MLATTALLLIPLMVFAAFAVDVGAWYAEADSAQRAADAAALAAAAELPNEANAIAAAIEVAALNGFVDQVDCDDPDAPCDPSAVSTLNYPQVLVKKISDSDVQVTIITEGETHFGAVAIPDGGIKIERFASAELNRPIQMGSPRNSIGTGVDDINGDRDNFVLNLWVNGSRGVGDPINADPFFVGPPGEDFYRDDPNNDNGFLYTVSVPPMGAGLTATLQVRRSCFRRYRYETSLNLKLYSPQPATTPLNYYDNITGFPVVDSDFGMPPAGCDNGQGESFDFDESGTVWQDVANLTEGVWTLAATGFEDDPLETKAQRVNYALRVVPPALAAAANPYCSTLGEDPDNPTCPTVAPLNYLNSLTFNGMFPAGAGSAELYLVNVPDEKPRAKLEILFFDTADGIDYIEILAPPVDDSTTVRVPARFDWTLLDESTSPPTELPADDDSVSGDYTGCPSGHRTCVDETVATFNNSTVIATVDFTELPGGKYECETDCWWKVRYRTSGNISETVTWRARIIGDPIRLTE